MLWDCLFLTGGKTMHRSQLAGFIIDCQTDDLETAAGFWSRALGLPRRASSSPEDSGYALLETAPNGLHIEVQKVDHPSRVHLDIEADDVEAEVRRLEALGAKRLKQIRTWWVMEAPTGQRFCVVRPQRANFAAEANRWE
jgi:predicted enzyme related to lactoylglutathione lyase